MDQEEGKPSYKELAESAYFTFCFARGEKAPEPFHELNGGKQLAWEAVARQLFEAFRTETVGDERGWRVWARGKRSVLRAEAKAARRKLAKPPAPKPKAAKPAGLTIYTDGSCLKNPGGAMGWACLMLGPDQKPLGDLSGGAAVGTNNQAELMAAITALEALPEGASATLYSDSQYVVNGITKWIHGWRRKNFEDVKNLALWLRLDAAARKRNIEFLWVKGHAGNVHNHKVDRMALAAAKRFLRTSTEIAA